MLHTVTLSTGFDETVFLAGGEDEAPGRILGRSSEPSGKGINTARVAAALGAEVCAWGLVGGDDIDIFRTGLRDVQVTPRLWAVPGACRRNLTIVRPETGEVATHYRAEMPEVDYAEAFSLLANALEGEVRSGDIMTLNGSVPPGLVPDAADQIVEAGVRSGATTIVDTYGPALRSALKPGVYAATPNLDEATTFAEIDTSLSASAAVNEALDALSNAGAEVPLITLGSGGVAFRRHGGRTSRASLAGPPARQVVGAGDAFVAGLAAGTDRGRSLQGSVCFGVAVATAHVAMTPRCDFADTAWTELDKVRVEILDRGQA